MEGKAVGGFVEFRNVRKVYQMGEITIEALHDVNFIIEKGEICVIVGPSGAGKTTLLNILGGMDRLTSGQVLLDGTEVSAFPNGNWHPTGAMTWGSCSSSTI